MWATICGFALGIGIINRFPTSAFPQERSRINAIEENSKSIKPGEYMKTLQVLGKLDALARQRQKKPELLGDPFADKVTWKASNDSKSELAQNENPQDLFEGDIVLSLEQAEKIYESTVQQQNGGEEEKPREDPELQREPQPFGDRKKRKVISNKNLRWATVIPYKMSNVDGNTANVIRAGLQHWESKTCLRFYENPSAKDYLLFFIGNGCYSSIGRQGGQQGVSIGNGCAQLGIVAHEVGHALGIWHEQSRPDRDAYISINWQNIAAGTDGNFFRRSWPEMLEAGGAYDLGSIMHYSSRSFTSNWQTTINTIDPRFQNTIGQRVGVSFIDAKQMNNIYCSGNCAGVNPGCTHGGYPDPTNAAGNCNSCICPSGLGGATCSEAAPSNTNCGGNLQATAEWQTFGDPSSPGSPVLPSLNCNWYITAPPGGRIYMEFDGLDFNCQATQQQREILRTYYREACYDFVEIKAGNNFEQTGFRFCCGQQNQIVSVSNEAVVMLRTSSSVTGYGFRLRYRTDVAVTTTTVAATTTTSTTAAITSTTSGTTRPIALPSGWSQWQEWSTCTATCGMCGQRERRRICLGSDCSNGFDREREQCGDVVCDDNGNSIGNIAVAKRGSSSHRRSSSHEQRAPNSYRWNGGNRQRKNTCCTGFEADNRVCVRRRQMADETRPN